MNNKDIAKVCHSVNTAYCHAIGDDTAVPWDEASDSQKDSAVDGVAFHLNDTHSPEESHKAWMDFKISEGWKYGEIKDEDKKEHPCLIPYEELPEEQRVKDFLFAAVVEAMATIDMAVVRSVTDLDDGDEKKMPVTYIGKRPTYNDTFIKGLVWEKGETKRIVNSVARKMLVHFDVYCDGDTEDIADDVDVDAGKDEENENPESDAQNLEEETRSQIQQMTRKDAIVDFCKNEWGIDVDKSGKTVKQLQEIAIMHIDNLGLVANDTK